MPYSARFGRTQRLTAINLLRGSGFLSSYCFPEFANASSVVDLGNSLTMKARTVSISSGHAVLFQADTGTETQRALGFFLEVFDRHRGRQSRNESQENYMITIASCAYDSNTIYEHTTTSDAAPCSVASGMLLPGCCFQHLPSRSLHVSCASCPSDVEAKFYRARDRTLSGILRRYVVATSSFVQISEGE